MGNFLEILMAYYPGVVLSSEEEKIICNSFVFNLVSANEYLIKCGEYKENIYFIEEGAVRCWNFNTKCEEVSFLFAFKGDFVFSVNSLFIFNSSDYNIQTLSDSKVWVLDRISFKLLINLSEKVRFLLVELLLKYYDYIRVREMYLLHFSPEERYRIILKEDKRIMQNVPLKHIASYIGITPEALSRIRRRIHKNI
ncbi:Crp/Fnr family transcriptional regulator [uncultured Parabacteroides sp.]|uniref:Crp/Fnr family transcriptional regulator n=1 Tax=uncultured Parabacteroides sp. TaxID=512312 RepID=UPI002588494F|nr:Crp/Fnr family transcriptional regulator [uncultured Parabacteroides sp.]